MEQNCDGSYPSAPLEDNDLQKRIEKTIDDVNSFNSSINNKKMIKNLKDKKNKSKKRYRNYKAQNTVSESVDSIFSIGATSTSIRLSITGVGLNILPISAGIASALSLRNKVLQKLIINKYKKYKKQYGKDQQTIKCFDKLYIKPFQDNVIDKTEYEILCHNFTKYLDEKKMNLF